MSLSKQTADEGTWQQKEREKSRTCPEEEQEGETERIHCTDLCDSSSFQLLECVLDLNPFKYIPQDTVWTQHNTVIVPS